MNNSSEMMNELKNGMTKGIFLWEVIYMYWYGIIDGRNGIPKENQEGLWVSSIINKEKNRYEEYCTKMWGSKEIELREIFERCEVLKKEIPLMVRRLECAREQEKKSEPVLIERKHGEEELSDNQVAARRKREEAKRKKLNHAEVAKLESELLEEYNELLETYNYSIEIANGIRFICSRVLKHSNQRLDIYWRAVLKVHPENERMPMVVFELGKPQAEEMYLEKHKGISEEVLYVLSKYEKEVSEIRIHSFDKNEGVA